jgi:hypothetical protein
MLYQKGSQRIEVIVRKESGVSTKGANETRTDSVSTDKKKLTGSQQQKKDELMAVHILSVSKQVSKEALSFYFGGYGFKNGDTALQQIIDRQFEVVEDTANTAYSLTTGAIYGGPLGFALSALTSGASLAFKYAGRIREFNYTMFAENNEIQYNRAKAGTIDFNGRLR